VVNQERQAANRDDQKLHSERVVVPVISGLELGVDQVHGGVHTTDVDDLEDTERYGWILSSDLRGRRGAESCTARLQQTRACRIGKGVEPTTQRATG